MSVFLAHQRAAVLREVQRLKIEETLFFQSENGHNEKGTLVISNITLPLKEEYVEALRKCKFLSVVDLMSYFCLLISNVISLHTVVSNTIFTQALVFMQIFFL